MKIGIVGDIHLGINENKPKFKEYQLKCLKYIHKKLKEENIKDIIYLGDIFDKRQFITVKTLKTCFEIFNNDFNQYFILGNHDVAYKNSNQLNSVEILLGDNNSVIVDDSKEIIFDNKKLLLVPWINKNNQEKITKQIEKSKAEFLFGHLDLQGFEMLRGIYSRHSDVSIKLLQKFEKVISGHFHCYSEKDNICYLGNICQMTWNDYNEKKYYGILETKTEDFILKEIPYSIYEKIRINSEDDCEKDILRFKDKIVKCYLYVDRNVKIEKFLIELIDVAMSVNIIDNQVMLATSDFKHDNQNMNILDLWQSYIKELNLSLKETKIINKIFEDTYIKFYSGEINY